jgi:hypothetical protein
MQNILKYLWIIPALYVSYFFGGKLFEVLDDATEFVEIISVIAPLSPVATLLAYAIGVFDFVVALALLIVPNISATKKYTPYMFVWVILWPLVPASLRYFGGVAEFEIVEVAEVMFAGIVAGSLWYAYAKK